jgi:putative Holliday junction resolvase
MRRVGVAISDLTRTLARPVGVLRPEGRGRDAAHEIADEIARLQGEEDGVSAVVLGLPCHLDGSASDMTAHVRSLAEELARLTGLPVALQDERLTSREAESRLALTIKDWRVRKNKLDAASATLILQDYLDAGASRAPDVQP